MAKEEKLKKLYEKYLQTDKFYFFLDAKKYSTTLKGLKLTDEILEQFFLNYVKPSFISFLSNLKMIIYSNNVYDFITQSSTEDWNLWPYLYFLEKEKIIKVKKTGKVSVLKKDILDLILRPQSEKEIKDKIEKKLKIKIQEKEPVINLFKNFQNFKVKADWDQMSISQSSAIFLVEKILEKIPLKKKFLFVGDDDFISVILGLVQPQVESLVVDMDEELLRSIDVLAKKFNLKIETEKVDIGKQKILKKGFGQNDYNDKFIGFLANPVYTEEGVREFVKFGLNQLSADGGWVFLAVGDESIGSRFLFLQDFFTKKNLIIKELITKKIFYPYIELYQEDKLILQRLSQKLDKKLIKNSPKLAASLYLFEYLPFRPKRIKFKKPIYAYL